ncbi:UbiH/UbiF family hydroxylase [Flexibacterium corallicola]|uniref:UbiH/UbiF family hydroxylase n=1 Tax=Flexibacterium corallicola TaxID=3037259 RepID=UPI00286F5EA1|nr:UbiH/UbiF family hydroxylase [Pseudovibrio sp. M1P-2-3]
MIEFESAVIGTGPAGMFAALSLASQGIRTALVGPLPNWNDTRTTALMASSVTFMRNIGIWNQLESAFTPLKKMRLVDVTERLIRAPEALFDALELGLDSFGYNIKNNELNRLLWKVIQENDFITYFDGTATQVTSNTERAHIILSCEQEITTQFIIGADGRGSKTREAAGINVKSWKYSQAAVVLNLDHSLPHNYTSTEFHQRTGPFTLVPLPGNQSSLVCVVTPSQAQEIKALSTLELGFELEKRAHSLLGAFKIVSDLQVYPLSGFRALRLSGNRSILIGEAAHAFPPIGAQGLNLSIRDIAVATDLAFQAKKHSQALGNNSMLAAFERSRSADIITRTNAVDLLNRSLLSDALPIQAIRTLGLLSAVKIPMVRKVLMREGIAPTWNLPRLMQDTFHSQ